MVLGLAVAGLLAWSIGVEPDLTVDASALRDLPLEIAGWESRDVPVGSTVESVLNADANVQRLFRHPSGHIVWTYVGYYGTQRGGRPEHTPRGCYTGAGWGIDSSRVLSVTPDSSLEVNEYQVSRRGERRLVHFWYRSHRATGLVGGFEQNLDRMVGRLFHGRADGALMRVSTPLTDGDIVAARSRLLSFSPEFDRQVGAHWPEERPAG
jgi:EpsI family protein